MHTSRTLRVLIIGGSEDLAANALDSLQRAGFRTLCEQVAAPAARAARDLHPWDLVIGLAAEGAEAPTLAAFCGRVYTGVPFVVIEPGSGNPAWDPPPAWRVSPGELERLADFVGGCQEVRTCTG